MTPSYMNCALRKHHPIKFAVMQHQVLHYNKIKYIYITHKINFRGVVQFIYVHNKIANNFFCNFILPSNGYKSTSLSHCSINSFNIMTNNNLDPRPNTIKQNKASSTEVIPSKCQVNLKTVTYVWCWYILTDMFSIVSGIRTHTIGTLQRRFALHNDEPCSISFGQIHTYIKVQKCI